MHFRTECQPLVWSTTDKSQQSYGTSYFNLWDWSYEAELLSATACSCKLLLRRPSQKKCCTHGILGFHLTEQQLKLHSCMEKSTLLLSAFTASFTVRICGHWLSKCERLLSILVKKQGFPLFCTEIYRCGEKEGVTLHMTHSRKAEKGSHQSKLFS